LGTAFANARSSRGRSYVTDSDFSPELGRNTLWRRLHHSGAVNDVQLPPFLVHTPMMLAAQ
jgi:hypothetical protein